LYHFSLFLSPQWVARPLVELVLVLLLLVGHKVVGEVRRRELAPRAARQPRIQPRRSLRLTGGDKWRRNLNFGWFFLIFLFVFFCIFLNILIFFGFGPFAFVLPF
jgi:hypothetical protein